MEERSRKRLWEDYVFQFLQKVPQENITKCVKNVASLADDMLQEHDDRWRPRARVDVSDLMPAKK